MKNSQTGFIAFLNYGRSSDFALLLLRIVVALLMMTHGIDKIQNYSSLASTFPNPIGMGSEISLILVIFSEVVCSALVMIGLLTRLALIPLIFSTSVAAFVVHSPFTIGGSELLLLYLVIYVALLLSGPGRYSIDRVFYNLSYERVHNPTYITKTPVGNTAGAPVAAPLDTPAAASVNASVGKTD